MNYSEFLIKKNAYKPSPDRYQTNTSSFTEKSNSIRFPKSHRSSLVNANSPGPAKYMDEDTWKSQSFYKSKSCKISRSDRKIDFTVAKDSPGRTSFSNLAGNYMPPSLFDSNKVKSKGFTLRVKT